MTEKNTDNYYSSFKHILAVSNLIPCVNMEQSEEKIHLYLEHDNGTSHIYLIPIFPGMALLGIDYHLPAISYETFLSLLKPAKSSPNKIMNIKKGIRKYKDIDAVTKFNYCHCGRTELFTGNDVYVYMKEHEFCIDKKPSFHQCNFPQGYYLGFGLAIEKDFPLLNPGITETFGIDIDELCHKYLNKDNQFTYITSCNSETLSLCQQIFHISCNYQKGDIYKLRTLILQLITAYQFSTETSPIGPRTFLSNSQICIAKNVAKRISQDLSLRVSAKEMAADYGISETSLKNYFREVYGENLSVYGNRLRMEKAAKLLQNTSLSISVIAEQVGYSSQSKFAAAFKKYYEVAPVEFRRKSALSLLDS